MARNLPWLIVFILLVCAQLALRFLLRSPLEPQTKSGLGARLLTTLVCNMLSIHIAGPGLMTSQTKFGASIMAGNIYPSEWLRGVLEICVLKIMNEGPTYGYAIAEKLTEAGFGTIKGGTLYPLLSRLEQSGLVTNEWRAGDGGPGRKYYRLTSTGRRAHQDLTRGWLRFSEVTTSFLSS